MLKIGITTRVSTAPPHGECRDQISVDWQHYLSCTFPHSIIIPIPNHLTAPSEWASALHLDAVILSNGNDCGSCPQRDLTETELVNWAITNKLPLLGVCRGFQFLNLFFGGTLLPDLRTYTNLPHAGATHEITISPTFQHLFLQHNYDLIVNSYHNMGISQNELSPSLFPFAVTPDHLVEGFYHPTLPVMGIQWHPERSDSFPPFTTKIIQSFISNGIFW